MRARFSISFSFIIIAAILCAAELSAIVLRNCTDPSAELARLLPEIRINVEVSHWPGFNAAARFAGILPHGMVAEIQRGRVLEKSDLPALEKWAIDRTKALLERWRNVSDGRFLSLMSAFSGEVSYHAVDKAVFRSARPDVAVLSPGHGVPGGSEFFAQVLEPSGSPLIAPNHFELQVSGEALMRYFGAQPGVKKSKVIFFNSCSTGVPSETASAPAARLAIYAGTDVIAPIGNLTVILVKGKLRISVRDPVANKVIEPDQAFLRFTPEGGKPKPVTFDEAMKAIFRADAKEQPYYSERERWNQ